MHRILHKLDAEHAHNIAIWLLHRGITMDYRRADNPILASEAFGLKFSNPIGLAAGFDKNAHAIRGLNKLGFGFLEIGSVTPRPQEGNPKPRLFRLADDDAIINRLGFNNFGIDVFAENFFKSVEKLKSERPVIGINIGANKDSENFYDDYLLLIERCSGLADYITVNISSPNTPGLRDLQKKDAITRLLKEVVEIRNSQKSHPPLLVKIAPDLADDELYSIADIIQGLNFDGVIATNTTTSRGNLKSKNATQEGGLSGAPLTEKSTNLISKLYKYSEGNIKIIGVGGVFTGQDAFDKIAAGASLVQIYTSLIYRGPRVVTLIKKELAKILKERGFKNVTEAIGSAVK